MFSEWSKSRTFLVMLFILPLVAAGFFILNQRQAFRLSPASEQPIASDMLATMKETLAKDRVLLANYERDQIKLREEVIKRRKLYQNGEISQDQVKQAEQSYISAVNRVYEMRTAVVEGD